MDEEAVFHEARSIVDPKQRTEFLDKACAGQPDLRKGVEALLAASESSTGFLERPAVARPPADLGRTLISEGPDSMVGPYKLIEQIGEGGFGVVFLAEQQEPIRRTVAVKTIKPGMDTRQVIARFEGERQALALMEHPHIARILDGGVTVSGKPYFVMELVVGVPITEYCDTQRLTPRERLAMFIPVCRAVQHAHQKGIIHRDLKPSNVLIADQDGEAVPKVIDFGVAKALGQPLSEPVATTGLGRIIGTLEYMSPEQAEFKATDIDTRADIYSLGVMLYELLTGTTPVVKERLHSAAVTELLRVIREEDPPCPSNRLTDSKDILASVCALRKLEPAGLTKAVRGELDWIVMKCLEKDRNRRYETANDLVRDIEHYLNDEPVEAGPPSAIYKLRKLARKHRKLIGVAGAFAVFLGMATVLAGLLAVRASRAERAASQDRDRAVAEKRRADSEASIASAVNEFLLQDLLSQADVRLQPSDTTMQKDVTIRELLDRASRTVEGRFHGQELTEAAIRRTLGNAFRAVGEYTQAEVQLKRSQELREAKLPPEHPDLLESLHDLGLLDEDRGQYEKAEGHLVAALDGFRKSLGESHHDTQRAMASLATFYQSVGRLDDSERLYQQLLEGEQPTNSVPHETVRRLTGYALLHQARGRYADADGLFHKALELSQTNLGADHPYSLTIQNNLGILYRLQGKYEEAENVYKRVLEVRRRLLGAEHPETLVSISNLAAVYLASSRYAEAEQLFRPALEISQRVLGPDHPDTFAIMSNLGVLYRSLARYDDAERMHRQALEGRRRILGDHHIDTLASLNNLGAIQMTRGQLDDAEVLFGKALADSQGTLGADHPQTLGSMNSLASLYHQQGKLTEAEALYRQVLEKIRPTLGADHPNTLTTTSSLARLLQEKGQLDEAEPLAREAMEAFQKKLGANHPMTLQSMQILAMVYRDRKNLAASTSLLEQTLTGRRQKLGAEHPQTLKTQIELAVNYGEAGRLEEAESLLREAWIVQAAKDPNQWATFQTQFMLGSNLLEQRKFEASESALLSSYQGMLDLQDKQIQRSAESLADAATRLVELYEAWSKPEEAAKWRTVRASYP